VEYLRNFYGVMDDAINGGTETDRMLVHWDLRSDLAADASAGKPRPASFAAERERGAVVALSAGSDGLPVPGPAIGPPAAGSPGAGSPGAGSRAAGGPGPGTLLVGVPADVESLRVSDPAGAAVWRSALRDVLAPLIAGGARVTGFDRDGWYVVSTATDEAGRGEDDEADRG
jgi:predicted GNAT superfamily acetyltransferase